MAKNAIKKPHPLVRKLWVNSRFQQKPLSNTALLQIPRNRGFAGEAVALFNRFESMQILILRDIKSYSNF